MTMRAERQSFDAMLAGRASGRPPWLPLVAGLAARVAATSYRELTLDPGLWAAGLVGAAELLEADALVVGFDLTLTAEACGAELSWSGSAPVIVRPPPDVGPQPLAAPRQAAMLETVRRLSATASARFGLVAAVIGPATLALQLCPDVPLDEGMKRVKSAHMAVTEAVLKARPDVVMFVEHLRGSGTEPLRAWQRAFGTLRNLAAHYDVPTAVYVDGWAAHQVAALATLKVSAYLLGTGAGDALASARILAAGPAAVGVPLAGVAGVDARAMVAAVCAARDEGCNLFLTTAGAVTADGDLAGLRAFAAQLHGLAA